MYFVITIPKNENSYTAVASRLYDAYSSLAVLHSIVCTYEWITPTCLVASFSSQFLTASVLEEKLHQIYDALYDSLPAGQVSDMDVCPNLLFRFLNINVSLK